METIGRTKWAIPGGCIPLRSTGREPAMVSHETLCLLNPNAQEASVKFWIYHADHPPIGPYSAEVPAYRAKRIRTNDLINPQPIWLGVEYSVVIESDVPIIVQFTRLDSSQSANAQMSTIAFPVPENTNS